MELVKNIDLEIQDGSFRAEVLKRGMSNAVTGLSQMVGREIKIASLNIRRIPVKDISDLFGGPEAIIVGVYLQICGNSNGHMIAVYKPQTAFDLVDLLLGQPAGSTKDLSEMERSVLGEVGNIMGSFFLNHLANSTGIELQPSPPAVLMDMAGAILDVATASVLEYSDHTFVIETIFETSDGQVAGTFLVMPVPGFEMS
ncbi:MAG: chemotaxis protein CheC [Dehalococcoidales bacterium]|nr:chemotaxis protein CheC [Dehalococcoidales bacterium]